MDFNQLLDTSTLFDANKLVLLEKVVEILYVSTTNNNDVSKSIKINNYIIQRNSANKLLDNFKKLNISYTYCEFILNNEHSNNTRVLALNILEIFIKEKWNYLNENSKLNLRIFLESLLVNYVTNNGIYNKPDNSFLINKLNKSLSFSR